MLNYNAQVKNFIQKLINEGTNKMLRPIQRTFEELTICRPFNKEI